MITELLSPFSEGEAAALAGCALRGTFAAGGPVTKGDWAVTFPAENS